MAVLRACDAIRIGFTYSHGLIRSVYRRNHEAPDQQRVLRDLVAANTNLATHAHDEPEHDTGPRIGDALGLVPGFGYVCAGKHANAVDSLILTRLFAE